MDEKEKERRQYYLRLFGYDASGDWTSEQEEAWKKITTKNKKYLTSILGLINYLSDLVTGNTTYYQDPEDKGEIRSDNRTEVARKIDNELSNPTSFAGYIYQNIIPSAALAASAVNPLATIRVALPASITGAVTSEASNAISEAITGKSTEELAEPYIGHELSILGNPGTYAGVKTARNFFDFERYVMDEVFPASYVLSERLPEFTRAGLRAMNPFSSPPKFYNRQPKWAAKHNPPDKQARIENQARWVGVSEKEVPRIVTRDNPDGTVGFNQVRMGAILPDAEDALKAKNRTVKEADNVFGPGGLHSDFTLVRTSPDHRTNLWLYKDKQVINPLWLITDALKRKLGIRSESKTGKAIDWFGKKDLKTLLGFKNDVNYKQYLLETDRGIFPIPNEQVEGLVK